MAKLKTFFTKINDGRAKLLSNIKKINIYGNGKFFFIAPLVVVLITIICGCIYQFGGKYDSFANIGVDFKGGTMLTVEFTGADDLNSGDNYDKNLAIIEDILSQQGFKISVAQSSGDSAIIVKYVNTATLNGQAVDYSSDSKIEEMNTINSTIIENISDKVTETYGSSISASSTTTLIGNSASVKLLKTALIAIAISLAVILLYVIIRFDLYSGLSAILALMHDIIMMMCFTVIFYIEINSTIVGAIITIVGYSINDTIIIFDKVRTTVKPYKSSGEKYDFVQIVNHSIFATITRTLYTSMTTLFTIALIVILGVSSIRAFALPICFGLISGVYSTIFLAAPMWGSFKDLGAKYKIYNANRKFKNKAKEIQEKKTVKLKAKKA